MNRFAHVMFDLLYAVLVDLFDDHALEIDRHSSLQFIRAHSQNLHALIERYIGVMMLVQYRKAVVSFHDQCQSAREDGAIPGEADYTY